MVFSPLSSDINVGPRRGLDATVVSKHINIGPLGLRLGCFGRIHPPVEQVDEFVQLATGTMDTQSPPPAVASYASSSMNSSRNFQGPPHPSSRYRPTRPTLAVFSIIILKYIELSTSSNPFLQDNSIYKYQQHDGV